MALDLVCGQYVFAPTDRADPRVLELKAKSVVGDCTLVCAACFIDYGLAVPIVVRSQLGGSRRPHFAHPPGSAPVGGEHHPETLWHLNGKMVLARWARRQPGVVDVRTEAWLPGGERRSDVLVVFADGRRVALEVQSGPVTDYEWTTRHEDYRRNDVVDVWLWRGDSPPRWIVVGDSGNGQQLWTLDPDERSVRLLVGLPHRARVPGSSAEDAGCMVAHLPPCVEDRLLGFRFRLDELELTPLGITVPALVTRLIARSIQRQREPRDAHREGLPAPTDPTGPVRRTPADPPRVRHTPQLAEPALSAEAVAHLRWTRLESAFIKAGHVPAYQDSP
ncbi:competence protein CoiA family protein [Nocardia takedensis]|uniref:competence protein CoiA family protein n=1 Tax=Nocardia takedensis TaxID=259390 RepID=UPI003F774C3D